MDLNYIIFPAPKSSYTSDSKNLVWITGEEPKCNKSEKTFTRKFHQFKVRARIISNDNKENASTATTHSRERSSGTLLQQKEGGDSNKVESADSKMQKLQAPIEQNSVNVQQQKQRKPSAIPCLWLPYEQGCDKVIIYFHGNAEDLGYSFQFTDALRKNLQINVLAVEYPGYGAYVGEACSEKILQDAEVVFDFLTDTLGIAQQDIFLFGRSIGSGPATHLASKRRPGALMLMCPYKSIRSIVKDLVGSVAQYLVAERFRNIDKITKVKCPSFFVHGQQDKLIPYQHSIELMSNCSGMTYLSLSEKMTHNDFHMTFMRKCEIDIRRGANHAINIDFVQYKRPENKI